MRVTCAWPTWIRAAHRDICFASARCRVDGTGFVGPHPPSAPSPRFTGRRDMSGRYVFQIHADETTGLAAPQRGVQAILLEQFLMAAAFDHAAAVHHDQAVEHGDGGQAVGDGDDGLAFHQRRTAAPGWRPRLPSPAPRWLRPAPGWARPSAARARSPRAGAGRRRASPRARPPGCRSRCGPWQSVSPRMNSSACARS